MTAAEFGFLHNDGANPVFLKEFAKGVNPSHSMPTNSLHAHYNRITNSEYTIEPLVRVKKIRPIVKKTGSTRNVRAQTESKSRINYEYLKDVLTVARDSDHSTEIEKLIARLESIINELPSIKYSVEILISWLLEGLSSRKWKHPETPKKYAALIGESWLKHSIDIEYADGADMDYICQSILDEDIYNENKANRLRDLIIYGVKYCELAVPDDPFYSINNINGYVRTLIVPEHITRSVRNDLSKESAAQGKHYQLTMDNLFVVLSRCILRPTELVRLRMDDVEISDEGWIFVRPHKGEKLKRISSKRKVMYGSLLKSTERKSFETYVKLRKQQTSGDKNTHLFSKSELSDEPFEVTELEYSVGKLVSNYMGMPVPIYQYRHTAVNTLFIITFGSQSLIEKFTPYSDEEILRVKDFLLGNRSRDRLWAIAHAAGHQTPKTTLYSYIHCCDLILHEKSIQNDHKDTAGFWLNLSGLPSRQIKKITQEYSKEIGSECVTGTYKISKTVIPASQLLSLLNRKAKKLVATSSRKDTRNLNDAEIELNSQVKPDIQQCYKVLKNLDNNYSVAEVLLRSPIDENIVLGWILRAKEIIGNYRTSQNKSRLVSNNLKICPYKPHSEEVELETLLKNLRVQYRLDKQETFWCIEYLLSHITSGSSCITFNDFNDYLRFMKIATRLANSKNWYLNLELGHDNNGLKKSWCSIKDISTHVTNGSSSSTQIGKLYFLRSTTTSSEETRPQSSRVLRYVFHMAKIMISAEYEIK
jgi:integrase